MVNNREPLIRRWLEWNMGHERESWETPRQLELGVRGMTFRGSEILEGDRVTRLAEYIRVPGERGIVRMTLPNPLSIDRHRLIRRIAEAEGFLVLLAPRSVIDQADIQWATIQIIDTAETKEPFRAAEQLIRATVRVYTGVRGRVRGGLWTYHEERTAYFLSGFDRNERRLSYFFCELPPGAEPTTVAEAYQALRPASVVAALDQGRRVLRQGDMFMIQMPRRFSIGLSEEVFDKYVHGTNHMADRYAYVDGLVYIRGRLRHRPTGRRPDHKTLHLGGRWWLCVKNTVPVTR